MNSRVKPQASAAIICTVIAAIGAVAYANTLAGEFVWDDASSILNHEDVKDPARFSELFAHNQHRYGRGEGRFYRPLLSVSFMIDYQLARIGLPPSELTGVPNISPVIFHISSIAWHIAAAIALFFVVRGFNAPVFVQWAVPIVWVVHPLHTEAVAYISGRGDSMAAAFLFAGLAFSIRAPKKLDGAFGMGIGAGLCMLGAVLSKESGAMLIAVAAWGAICLARAQSKSEDAVPALNRFVPVMAAAAALVIYVLVRQRVFNAPAEEAGSVTPLMTRAVEAMQSLAVYAKLMVTPTHLHMERTLDGVPVWFAGVGAAVVLALIAALAIALRAENPRIAMASGLFLITWFPISGLIPLNAPLAEHWMYVPLAGAVWLVAELVNAIARSWGRPQAAYAAMAAAVVFFLPMTADRNLDWRDNITLFEATLEENPNTLRVRFNLAVALESIEENLPAARRVFQSVVTRFDQTQTDGQPPTLMELDARLALGNIALETNRPDIALDQFQRIIQRISDERYAAYAQAAAIGFGKALAASGQFAAAEQHFFQLAQTTPSATLDAWRVLGGRSLMFQQRL